MKYIMINESKETFGERLTLSGNLSGRVCQGEICKIPLRALYQTRSFAAVSGLNNLLSIDYQIRAG